MARSPRKKVRAMIFLIRKLIRSSTAVGRTPDRRRWSGGGVFQSSGLTLAGQIHDFLKGSRVTVQHLSAQFRQRQPSSRSLAHIALSDMNVTGFLQLAELSGEHRVTHAQEIPEVGELHFHRR
jgi:hypothetical protein